MTSINKVETIEKDTSSLSALSAHLSRQQQDLKNSMESIQKDVNTLKSSMASIDFHLLNNIQALSSFVKSFPADRNIPKEIDDLKSSLEEIKSIIERLGVPQNRVDDDDDDDDDDDEEQFNNITINFEGAMDIDLDSIDQADAIILIVTDKDACKTITDECIIVQNLWKQVFQQYSKSWKFGHLKLENDEYIREGTTPKNRPSIVVILGKQVIEIPLNAKPESLKKYIDILEQKEDQV